MRACNVAPSSETFLILISMAGYTQKDPHRVRELTNEMSKAGMEVPFSVQESLCAALALTGAAQEASEILSRLRAQGVIASERCLDVVVRGLVAEAEPSAAMELASSFGPPADGVKMNILRGFISCGELDKAVKLYSGVQGAALDLPPKFKDLIKILAGGDE